MDKTAQATFLRYRLDSVAQTRAHLHLEEKRTLLFFPDGAGTLPAGESVLLELAFADTEQTRLLRGSALGSSPGEGSWLELEHQGLVSAETESGLLSRRQHRRFGADLPVDVLAGDLGFPARLQDVSLVGARVLGAGFALRPGARISLKLHEAGYPERVGPAIAVWSNRSGAGLYFDRQDAAARAGVGTLYAALQRAWQNPRSAVHRRGCCQAGLLLEPPLPG